MRMRNSAAVKPVNCRQSLAFLIVFTIMDGGGAYGAGKSTGKFDILTYLKKPQVILRTICWLFSVIVFGCISNQGWEQGRCRYNGDDNACSFGTVIGVIGFLGFTLLLVLDALFENISGVQHRKYAVILDISFSGFWTFLWFVCFCYLADTWRRTEDDNSTWGESGVEAAIVFSFFSIGTCGGTTAFAVMRFRKGVSEQFTAGFEPDVLGSRVSNAGQQVQAGYAAFPTAGTEQITADDFRRADPYQPPFSGHDQRTSGDFHQVTY